MEKKNNLEWFTLHMELPSKKGYYGYGDKAYMEAFRDRRKFFAIHP